MTKMWQIAMVASSVLFVSFGSASALTVNADFLSTSGSYSGVGAAPDTGTFWNIITPTGSPNLYTSGALLASDGTTNTPVTFSVTNWGTWNFGGTAFASNLMYDYMYHHSPSSQPGTMNFSFNNLTVGGKYDVYLYSQNGSAANDTSTFSVGGMPTQSVINAGAQGSFNLGVNYTVFTNVTAVGGVISGTLAANHGAGSFNGFQLVQVSSTEIPEPTSCVLMALGLVGIGIAVRRRRVRSLRAA